MLDVELLLRQALDDSRAVVVARRTLASRQRRMRDSPSARATVYRLLEEADDHPIEQIGKTLRDMMPWMK